MMSNFRREMERKYSIKRVACSINKKVEEDLKSIYECIVNILQEPVIARKQVSRIMDAIEQFDEFPLRYHIYEKEPWKINGSRVYKYLLFIFLMKQKNSNDCRNSVWR